MDNLTRILELKSRQDTLQITREQLAQRDRALQHEETARQLAAARTVFENTQSGSPIWRNALGTMVSAYGGDVSAINVPDEQVAKQLGAAIKKINTMAAMHAKGRVTTEQLQNDSAEIAVAALMGIGAFSSKIDSSSGFGNAVELLREAAEGGQRVGTARTIEDIQTSGYRERTGIETDAMRTRRTEETAELEKRYKAQRDILGTGKTAGEKGVTLPVGGVYQTTFNDSLKVQTTERYVATPANEQTGTPAIYKERRIEATPEMVQKASEIAGRAAAAAALAQGVLRGNADAIGRAAAERTPAYLDELRTPRLAALAASADALGEAAGDPVKGWVDTFKFFTTDELFSEGYEMAVAKIIQRLQDADELTNARVSGYEALAGPDKARMFLDKLLEASGVQDPTLRARLSNDVTRAFAGRN